MDGYILKDIPDFEGRYQVTSCGQIYSLLRGRFLKPNLKKRGYLVVGLYRAGIKLKFLLVHRLVAQAFVDGYSEGLTVNHINMDKLDNRAENLEWIGGRENSRLAHKSGAIIYRRGKRKTPTKLSIAQVQELRSRQKTEKIIIQVESRRLGVCRQTVRYILQGRSHANI